MEQSIVVCGLGRVGWRVLEILQTANLPVVAIDKECQATDPRLGRARLVSGDCQRRDILEQAGVGRARGVLILTSEDLVNVSTALTVRSLNSEVRVVLRMFNQNLIPPPGQGCPQYLRPEHVGPDGAVVRSQRPHRPSHGNFSHR